MFLFLKILLPFVPFLGGFHGWQVWILSIGKVDSNKMIVIFPVDS